MVEPRLATTFVSGDRGQRRRRAARTRRHLRALGLHGRVRHRRAAEVRRQHAARQSHGRGGRGDGSWPGASASTWNWSSRRWTTRSRSSAIWRQRGPVMRERAWSPAPGPIGTLHPILEQIAGRGRRRGLHAPVFGAAKTLFDQAIADGWAELDIAAVHDLLAGGSAESTRMSYSLVTFRAAARCGSACCFPARSSPARTSPARQAGRAARAQALGQHDSSCWTTGRRRPACCASLPLDDAPRGRSSRAAGADQLAAQGRCARA